MSSDDVVSIELATANRILFQQGVVDAFGHVSARHPDHPDQFLLARAMAPGQVTAADILVFDCDSEPLAPGPRIYLERFIHGEIYRARPDVQSVVHSHSPSVVPFGIVQGVTLRPVCHMSGFLGSGAPVFEIRDCCGNSSDLLVRDKRLGAAVAESLGANSAVLMRGHGSTVVGRSIREAVYRAVYTEVNARLQTTALGLGPVTFLTDGEAKATVETISRDYGRAWDLWVQMANCD